MGKARQLDILALEPFYGGVRKQTLETLSRYSRHRWSIFKLPARRLERRLNTAAQWFSQQINRTPGLKCDVLFTSDAMNLADLLRLNPDLGHKPSVAYFYCNQLAGDASGDQQSRLALLGTAVAASEIWFDSMFHMREFLGNAAAMYDAHAELGGKQHLKELVAKSQLVHPPVEIVSPSKDTHVVDAYRKARAVCFDNREGADTKIFIDLVKIISERKEPIAVHVLGRPITDIPEGIPAMTIDIKREEDMINTMRRCEIYISAMPCDAFDPMAMRAMALGCIPVMPREGFYAEFLPQALHNWCLYDGAKDDLFRKIMDLWYLRRPTVARRDLYVIFNRYAPVTATKNFDRQLDHLVEKTTH